MSDRTTTEFEHLLMSGPPDPAPERPSRRPKRRTVVWIAGATAAAIVIAGGTGIYAAASASADAPDYRTATADIGSVTQSLVLTGTVSRVNQRTASFPVAGTVESVSVAVGDTVVEGQKLAKMDPTALKANLLAAQATLARDQATLAADESSTSTSGSGSGGSSGSSGAPTSDGSASSGSGSTGGSGRSGAGSAGGSSALQAQLKKADAALTQIQQDMTQANALCEPVTGSGTRSSDSTTSGKGSQGAGDPTPTAPTSPSPSSSSDPGSGGGSGSGSTPTPAQIAACQQALASIAQALQVTERQVAAIAGQLTASTGASGSGSTPSGSSSGSGTRPSSGSGTTGSTSTGSTGSPSASASGRSGSNPNATSQAARIAGDQAAIVQDEASVAQAQANLSDATLTAPIAGTVASIGFVAGTDASTSQGIVIIGPGAAAVTVDIPVADMKLVKAGLTATVTPAGGSKTVVGEVQSVQLLPSSSSSTTAYPATVTVADPPTTLAAGSTATVSVVTATAKDAVRIPASALSGRTGQSGEVTVLSGSDATRTAVQIGAVGGGWVEVTSGLKAGQQVVLADASKALPTNTSGFGGFGGFRTGIRSGGTGRNGFSGGAPPGAG